MNALPYGEILRLVADCVRELDLSDKMAHNEADVLVAKIDKAMDERTARMLRSTSYAGDRKRKDDVVLGTADLSLPHLSGESHGTYCRTEDRTVVAGGV